ncbi:hypothetical protein F960_00623 [Acinetobacter gerneri DSM 14967 = CIP 107464 = MTCC 9824]|jgi:hypothetical protein|uniref:Lipoprotein n=1 Tax=Acinetobacter gerneri DSM 14967 = CIP 107464 = MTCC 9824 TaxID=1120926 RepID=N8ZUZ1_9GAMM|nr:hypothetical protein F960_00623 [Acinetobacter gerneri DSM 14967 = CIP 107464 = MTCC 9824]
MNKFLILVICAMTLTACNSMDVRPTVGVSMGAPIK